MIGFHFGDPLFAISYVAFATLAAMGVLQWAAVRAQLDSLSLVPLGSRPTVGLSVGFLLVAAGYGGFLGLWWEHIMVPGLAGAELGAAFSAGVVIALGITLVVASLRRRLAAKPPETPLIAGGRLDFGRGEGATSPPEGDSVAESEGGDSP